MAEERPDWQDLPPLGLLWRLLDLDGSNAVTMRRVFGSGFDDLVAREDASGAVKWYGTGVGPLGTSTLGD